MFYTDTILVSMKSLDEFAKFVILNIAVLYILNDIDL